MPLPHKQLHLGLLNMVERFFRCLDVHGPRPGSTDLLKPTTRRGLLKKFTAGTLVGRGLAFSQETPIQISGRPIEIALTPVSPRTVRITIAPIENGQVQAVPVDGALVKQD